MQDSVFTKIIKGEVPCYRIYEDEHVFAFLDIYPMMPGHTLLIPKQQIDHLWDASDQLYHHLWDVVLRIQNNMKLVLGVPRVGVTVEGFTVPHAHIHIVPITQPSDMKKKQDMSREPDHVALASMAQKLRLSVQ